MTDWGVTPTGFVRPSYTDLLQQTQADLVALFGPTIDLASYSPLGQIAQVHARKLTAVWATAEQAYDAGYVSTATGQALDRLAENRSLTRLAATYAAGSVIFARQTAAPQAYPIPVGTTVATADRAISFVTTAAAEIAATATTSGPVPIQATVPGLSGNLQAGTITSITTPILGVDTVSNPAAITGGSDRETDAVLRSRIAAYNPAARATKTAMETAILGIDGVISVHAVEDLTANAVIFVIDGGESSEINQVIDSTRPVGIAAAWSRPETGEINVSATISGSADVDAVVAAISTAITATTIGGTIAYSRMVAVVSSAAPAATLTALTMSYDLQTATQIGDTLILGPTVTATPGSIQVQQL